MSLHSSVDTAFPIPSHLTNYDLKKVTTDTLSLTQFK